MQVRHVGIIVVVVLAAILLAAAAAMNYQLATGSQNVAYNLDIADVYSIIPSTVGYTAVQSSNTTVFSGSLAHGGYSSVSVSVFNATNVGNQSQYPVLISSSVFVAKNATTANALRDGIANALAQDIVLPNSPTNSSNPVPGVIVGETEYSYRGASTTILNLLNANAFNGTVPERVQASRYPLYESWSAFSYRNTAGFIVTTGYIRMNGSYSVLLAERLFQHEVDYNLT